LSTFLLEGAGMPGEPLEGAGQRISQVVGITAAMLEEVLGPRRRHKVSLGHFQEKPMTFLNKARY
jgi:hypothetical protein